MQTEPARPSDASSDPPLRRALRGDLDTIVLKALKKQLDERYATVNGFAEDIERYLHGQAVLARPDGVVPAVEVRRAQQGRGRRRGGGVRGHARRARASRRGRRASR